MTPYELFVQERSERIRSYRQDEAFAAQSRDWQIESQKKQYVYNFEWLGRPIIQNPVDMVAMQEIIWQAKPDLLIETGIAHGGSLIYYASLLELCAQCGGPANARVLGLDIDIREHNRKAIEAHPMSRRVSMMQGSSISRDVVADVRAFAKDYGKVMVVLDSNHTHEHVLAELEAYAPLVSKDSWCVVFDTFVEYMPEDFYPDRPWGKGDNPMTAVDAFLKGHPEFVIDEEMDAKLLLTVAPRGYLRRTA